MDQPLSINLAEYPVLLLNADYQPISYYPLSLRTAEWGIKLVYENVVDLVAEYPVAARSQKLSIQLPSVVALRNMRPRGRRVPCTRHNIFLRDRFTCQYCGKRLPVGSLELEHVLPVSRGGEDTWKNLVAACRGCNCKKDCKTPREAGMPLLRTGFQMEQFEPTSAQFYEEGRRYPPKYLHPTWVDWLIWNIEDKSIKTA